MPPNPNSLVKLIIGAGKASPSPPVGPALGSKGVKSMDFCKEFNARTAHFIQNLPIPARIIIKPDRSFTFTVSTPPTAWLVLKAAGLEKGAPGLTRISGGKSRAKDSIGQYPDDCIGKISLKAIYEIARIKKNDENLKNLSLEAVVKTVVATCKSVGVLVVN